MLSTPSLERRSRRTKRVCEEQISRIVKMPVTIDNRTAQIIALNAMNKSGVKIVLDGKEQDTKSLTIELKISDLN